jgi:hypothetical protein
MSDTEWKTLPHRPIEKLGERLWRVEGNVPGMDLKRVMTAAKLGDGRLVVHNAIALEEPAMAELDRWGEVGFVVVPNGYHRIDAARFHARYPKAKFLCPPEAKKRVEAKVPVAGGYELIADANVKAGLFAGLGGREGWLTVKDADGTRAILNDAVFNMPHVGGVAGFVLKHITLSTGGPRLTRIARLALLKDKRRFAEELTALAATPELRSVIVSHHQMITEAPSDTLRAVAATV